jgi:hypothetical protein
MNLPTTRHPDHLLHWIAAILLIAGFGLGGSTIIAWCASLVTFGQMVAVTLAFVLTGVGLFFTVRHIRQ